MSGLVPGARLLVACRNLDREGAGLTTAAAPTGASEDAEASIHVAGALPGEIALVEIEHVSPHRKAGRREAWGRLVEVRTPSPARVSPLCPGFGACGGCALQSLRYDEQLAWKRGLVVDALAPVVGRGVAIDACVPSPRETGYRNQAKYVVGRSAAGRIVLGSFAPRTHDVVDMAGCRLVEPAIALVAAALPAVLEDHEVEPFDEATRTGRLRYVVLRANAAGDVLVSFVTTSGPWAQARALAEALRGRCPSIVGVVRNVNDTTGNVVFGRDEAPLLGAGFVSEALPGGFVVPLAARAFFQLNRDVAFRAYGEIAAAVGAREVVVDLYAGVGCIALSLAGRARRVIAVEENAAATAAARAASAPHVEVVTADAASAIAGIDRADVVVLNPPRAGCAAAVLSATARLGPARVVYLSCNPVSLARDLAALLAAGYVPSRVTPFDMLPHTAHVETLVVLDRVPAPV